MLIIRESVNIVLNHSNGGEKTIRYKTKKKEKENQREGGRS